MASNGPGGEVVQVHEIAVDGLDATRLSAMLPSFADGTRAWRKRIQRPAAALANLDISDGQESNRHSMGKGTDVPSPRSLAKRDSVDNWLSEGPGDLDEVDPHLDGLVRKGLVDERKTRIQTLGQGLKEGVFGQQSTDSPHGGQSAAVTTAKSQTPNLNELFRN